MSFYLYACEQCVGDRAQKEECKRHTCTERKLTQEPPSLYIGSPLLYLFSTEQVSERRTQSPHHGFDEGRGRTRLGQSGGDVVSGEGGEVSEPVEDRTGTRWW